MTQPGPHSEQPEPTPQGQPSPYQTPAPQQPAPPMYAQPMQPEKTKNTLGLIALTVAVLGLILSFVKGALMAGWILLPIAFILGIVSLFLKNKKKGMGIAAIVVSVVGAVVAPIMFLAYVTDAADEALNAPPAQIGPDGETIEDKGTSRDNPLPVGSSVESKEWSYKINSVELNGTDAVLAANTFNDAPSDGQQYMLINVTATYNGNDPEGATPFGSVAYVSADGNTFASHDTLAVAPDAFDQMTTLYEGASTTGNIAIAVPSEGIENGVLAVSPDMFSGKSFVAVQ